LTNKPITEITKPDPNPVKLTNDFFIPFWLLFKNSIFKRAEIATILLMFIVPFSVSKTNFDEGYILKRISNANPNRNNPLS